MKAGKATREAWVKWIKRYGIGEFFDAFVNSAQGAESVCIHCRQNIYLDIVEGGGVPDWGSRMGALSMGLDYGCQDSPHTNSEGVGPHEPRKLY